MTQYTNDKAEPVRLHNRPFKWVQHGFCSQSCRLGAKPLILPVISVHKGRYSMKFMEEKIMLLKMFFFSFLARTLQLGGAGKDY